MLKLKSSFVLLVIGLSVLITVGCNKPKEEAVEEDYILTLTDKKMYENYSNKGKIIGVCPIGIVTKSIKTIYVDKGIYGESWHKIQCNEQVGFIDYDYDYKINKKEDFLIQNKEKLIECYDYNQEIRGKYQNKKAYFRTQWDSTETNGLQIIIVDGDDRGFYFDLKKFEPLKYKLFTDDTEMIIQKNKTGVIVNVIKDESGKFRRFHGEFMKFVKPKPRIPFRPLKK